MCGFAGYYAFEDEITSSQQEQLKEKLQLIQYRGPDHTGYFQNKRCFLGHQRLSIIDPDARANQPFIASDEQHVLVFNGEIYNFQELKNTLQEEGVSFSTNSDTELLLYWLREKGQAGIAELNGCFSLALYGVEKHELLLARDPMGINPLFISTTDEGIYFASERKAIPHSTELDWKAMNAFLSFTYVPGNKTGDKAISNVEAGTALSYKSRDLQIKKHFDLSSTFTGEAPSDELFHLMEKAVQDRLIADVPLGTFLSGGVDSSIISALAAKHHSDLNTFSIGFENPVLDESVFAKAVAQHIGSKHHHFIMTMDDLERHARLFLDHNDELFSDSSALAVSFLAEQTRKEVKVALSGDGADELFGGYRKHRAFILADQGVAKLGKTIASPFEKQFSRESKFGEKLRQIHRLGNIAAFPKGMRITRLARFMEKDYVQGAQADTFFNVEDGPDDLEQRMLFLDQKLVLEGDMLKKQDRMSMLHSLEVRVPFLDTRIVAFANHLQADQKYSAKEGKIILKEAFKSLLPASIFDRKKHGFEVPLDQLLRERFQDEVQNLLKGGIIHSGPMKTEVLKEEIKSWQEGNASLATLIWSLLVGQRWIEKYGKPELTTTASS